MGCVWERVWRLKTNWRSNEFSWVAHESLPAKWSHVLNTWLECEESWQMMIAGFCKYFVGKAFLWDIRETFCFAILSYLIHHVSTPHYIYHHYPHIERSAFQKENPTHYSWELEIVIPTIHCGFPQLLSFHIQILERLIAQTLTTPILSVKWGFGVARKYWKKPFV